MSRQDSTKISDVKVLLKMGSNGSGIASIEKTGSDLNVDTYTITLDDGTKTTFTVTNGTSIASIEKTGTVGLVDTYTITLTDGSTSTFEVVNGEGSTASTVPYDNTISELTAENVQDAIDEIDATVDAQGESIDGIGAEIADMNNILGAKNFLPNNATTQAINGITFTVNNDGTVIANGTATANANLVLVSNLVLDAGSYILSGCPANGSVNTYYLYNDTVGSDYGNGFSFSYNIKTTTVRFGIMIKSGTTVSNITFKPMIRLATIKDDAYVPYSMTNRELSSQISSLANVITLTGTGSFYSQYRITKIGRIVFLAIYNIVATTLSRDIVIMTLPQEFRPLQNITVCGTTQSGQLQSSNNAQFYNIGTNGQIKTYTYFAINGGQFFATYISE